jgi:hypothetical protein
MSSLPQWMIETSSFYSSIIAVRLKWIVASCAMAFIALGVVSTRLHAGGCLDFPTELCDGIPSACGPCVGQSALYLTSTGNSYNQDTEPGGSFESVGSLPVVCYWQGACTAGAAAPFQKCTPTGCVKTNWPWDSCAVLTPPAVTTELLRDNHFIQDCFNPES